MKPRWAVLLILQILFPVLCLACTCALPTFEQQMKAATAVFTGKVLSTRHNGEQLEVKLQMIRTWKGPSGATILVETAENSAACGYSFEPDRVYLVYATGKEKLFVSLCSRTKLLTEAKEDLDLLEVTAETRQTPRDPFTQMKGDRVKTNKNIPKELNITNAVIVGITKKTDGYVALVRGVNNKVYFLKPGDKLHDGVVLKIENNSVTFRQYQGNRVVKKQLRPFPDE